MLDFNYLIVVCPSDSLALLTSSIQFFVDQGIKKFLFVLDFDRNQATVSMMLDRIRQFAGKIKPLRPRGIQFYVSANLFITNGILYDPQVSRLCIGHSNILCAQLPLSLRYNWIDPDLNHLLFHRKISPLFISFERNFIANPPTDIQRYTNSQFFRFAIDMDYITMLDAEPLVRQAICEKIPILPCVFHDWKQYEAAPKHFGLLRRRLGDELYFQLCCLIQQNGYQLFSQF